MPRYSLLDFFLTTRRVSSSAELRDAEHALASVATRTRNATPYSPPARVHPVCTVRRLKQPPPQSPSPPPENADNQWEEFQAMWHIRIVCQFMIKKAVTVQIILYSPVYDCSLRSSQKCKMGAAIKAL